MSDDKEVVRGLAIARTHFQLRAILAAMQAPRSPTPQPPPRKEVTNE